jgi:hypothetical protein
MYADSIPANQKRINNDETTVQELTALTAV